MFITNLLLPELLRSSTHIHPPMYRSPHSLSTVSAQSTPFCRGPSLAPVVLVFFCGSQDVCDQASADGFVPVSQSEPLAFFQNHRLAKRQCQGGVVPWHYHFLKKVSTDKGFMFRGLQILLKSQTLAVTFVEVRSLTFYLCKDFHSYHAFSTLT